MNAPIKTEDGFHQLIHQNHMWGLWEIASQMTPQPRPEAIAYQWKWSLLKEVVKQSASAVPVGDERRAMQLFNPGLNGQWATTKSLNAMFFETHKDLTASHGKPVNGSQALYGHGKLTPTWTKERPLFSPLMLYSWEQTLEALHDLRNHDGSPHDGISLEYTHAQ